MTFVRLKGNRVRVSLDRNEAVELFGNADRIDQNSPATRYALKLLLKRVVGDRLVPRCKRVVIEMTRNLSGGWDIYFIRNEKGSAGGKISVFRFSSVEDAINGAKAAAHTEKELPKSRFLRGNGHYLMTVLSPDESVRLALTEFCSGRCVLPEKVRPCGVELISSSALRRLSEL